MRALWYFLLLLLVIVQATTGQAPGDEDGVCLYLQDVLNEEVLMSSFNYRDLVASRGGPWAVVNNDDNNDAFTSTSVTTVSELRCTALFVILVLVDTSCNNLYKDCWCVRI